MFRDEMVDTFPEFLKDNTSQIKKQIQFKRNSQIDNIIVKQHQRQ